MRRFLTACAVTALLSVSACSSEDPAPVAQAPTSAAPATLPSAPEVDRAGQRACDLNKQAAGDLMKDGAVLEIADAASSAISAEIRAKGEALATRYRAAVLAERTDDEVTAQAQLLTAGTELGTACITAGLDRE